MLLWGQLDISSKHVSSFQEESLSTAVPLASKTDRNLCGKNSKQYQGDEDRGPQGGFRGCHHGATEVGGVSKDSDCLLEI